MTKKLDPRVHARRLALYLQDRTDKEMAEILGVKGTTIRGWRRKHNLPVVNARQKKEIEPVKNDRPPDTDIVWHSVENFMAKYCNWGGRQNEKIQSPKECSRIP